MVWVLIANDLGFEKLSASKAFFYYNHNNKIPQTVFYELEFVNDIDNGTLPDNFVNDILDKRNDGYWLDDNIELWTEDGLQPKGYKIECVPRQCECLNGNVVDDGKCNTLENDAFNGKRSDKYAGQKCQACDVGYHLSDATTGIF